jgi:ribose/xylose/arabinose/galactoside ABC-type transport system permease subunit
LPRAETDRPHRLARVRELGIFAFLVLLVACFGLATEDHVFVSGGNLRDLLRQCAILAVAAVGMTLVVLTGGIDLSVGSLMALSGLLAALLGRGSRGATGDAAAPGLPAPLVILLVLAGGFAWGAATAAFVSRLHIPPLITTLGTMSIGRGLVQWITGGESVRNEVASANWERLMWLGRGHAFDTVPAPVIVAVVVALLGAFVLHRTTFGTWLYGIGCNEEACRLSGVNVRRVKTLAYALAGAVFALAGVMYLGRQGYALPAAAMGFELDVVTAVVLGGVSITGGEGHVLGVMAGVLILGALDNGLTMLGRQIHEILVVKGAVLLLAVALDRFLRRAAA